MLASSIPHGLISKQLQIQARSHLEHARFYKTTQQFEMALASYDQAKVTFKNAENARQRGLPLSELKSAFTQALNPQTAEDESLRQHIAEVYVERAEVLKSLGELDKAQKSYEKARAWRYEGMPATSSITSISSSDRVIGLAQSAEFFPARASLAPLPKVAQACPQEKNQWVEQVFETILKQFQDLDLCQSSPSLFLVYAHNNNRLGKADAEASQRIIQWLSNLRSNLYSDRSASGHQVLPLPATLEESAKANDILSSQLCLLPNHSGTVDHVVLCSSELLGHYMVSPYYQGFCEAIQRAYQQANDFAQVEAAIRKVVNANLNKKEFHHVLTELAFLQIRYEHKKGEHGIIPLLLNSTAQQCLPQFIIDSTTIRIEDSIWRTPSLWNGRQTYQDEGLHIGFFKLLKRLLVKQERYIALVEEKIYQACLKKLREDHEHTLTVEEFSLFLNQACVAVLEALKQDHGSDLRELNLQKAYESLRAEIKQINGEALITPDQLRLEVEASYSAKRLAIQRLSGSPLPMEHCYINLAIVENEKEKANEEEKKLKKEEKKQPQEVEVEVEHSKEEMQNHFYRLPSSEAIHSNPQKLVPLEKLFEPRELSKDKTVTPKRILIRGRAGVGKTTLSKKIIYEYTQKGQWRDRFDYVLWIPLRTLKGKANCDLSTLFHETYFPSHPKGQSLAKTLVAQINGPAKDKTLFVLDGWDEIAQEWGQHEPMSGFLKQLLNQPAVLITSRPYADLGQANPMDLELETVGFSPENVTAYIDNPGIVSTAEGKEIKHFVEANAFIHELINVPIQLDALCYSWDEIKRMQKEVPGAMTVTALYQAMMNKLWRKDMLRLGKRKGGELLTASYVSTLESSSRIERFVKAEQDFLSALAFKGLQNNQIEFGRRDLNTLIDEFEKQGVDLPITLEANLKKLSFLHTDDAEENHRSYHFMHLTFQEFFAAKFLVRHLQAHANAIRQSARAQVANISIQLGINPSLEELESFIATHKYNPRYEIVWWMVAGLLDGSALERFFALLEERPRDLIGIRHQQVMMGCLNEARVQLNPATINKLEREFMQWLYFKKNLGCQRVFPEHLLIQCLSQHAVRKDAIIQILGVRPTLSSKAVLALLYALKHADSDVRSAAESVLDSQRSLSSDAVLALLSALKDGEWRVRLAAVSTLGNQRELSSEVVLSLLSALQDKRGDVRSAAANVLGKQHSLSSDAVLVLLSALQDEDRDVRSAATRALVNQHELSYEAVLALLSALEDEDGYVRSAAASTLGNQRELSADAVLSLLSALNDEDDYVRYAAASALAKQHELSYEAVLALLSALQDDEWKVRSAATRALGNQRELSYEAVLALLFALEDEDEDVQSAAARALGNQHKLSADAALVLLSAVKNGKRAARSEAARALSNQRELPSEVVLALLSALKEEDDYARSAAARALGNQRELSAEAVLALLDSLEDKDGYVRSAAARALGKQRGLSAEAVLALLSALEDGDDYVRSAATRALGNQRELSAEAVLALLDSLEDKDGYVRSAAASALGEQRELSADAVLALLSALNDEERYVRSAAASALGNQRELSAEAVFALLSALKHEEGYVRSAATRALGNQRELSIEAVLALLSALKANYGYVRSAAASALGNQRELSAEAVLALLSTLKDEEGYVRSAAASALVNQRELSADAVLALLSALKDEEVDVRSVAASALVDQRELSADAVLAFLSALKDVESDVRSAAAKALGKQRELSYEAILALLSALQDEDKGSVVRSAAARALGRQSSLSSDAILFLLSAWQDEDSDVQSAVEKALGSHMNQLFTLLPGMNRDQIKGLYTEFLLLRSVQQIPSLYIQNNQLHFYTAMGPGQPIKLSTSQSKKITEAFRVVQVEAGITSGLKRQWFW